MHFIKSFPNSVAFNIVDAINFLLHTHQIAYQGGSQVQGLPVLYGWQLLPLISIIDVPLLEG